MKKVTVSEKSGNMLAVGRMMYASLYTASRPSKTETDEKKFQYGLTVLLPADTDISALEKAVQEQFTENVVAAKRASTKWKNPIKKTADEGSLAQYADEYPYMLRLNSKKFDRNGKERARPEVVDAKGAAVAADREAEETYNGRWCRVSFRPFWFANEQSGVSLGLSNVQLLWQDDPLAGGKAKASSDFEPVEGLDDMDVSEEFA